MGWDGWGGTVHQKGPLIFFILRYIKHYTDTNLYIYKRNVLFVLVDEYWVSKIDKVYQFFSLKMLYLMAWDGEQKCPLFFLFSDILKTILT